VGAFPGLRASDDQPSGKNTGKAKEIAMSSWLLAA